MTRRYIGPLLVGAMALLSLAVYPLLPERIAIHWNLWGEVDGWAGKWRGAFLGPAIALGVWLVLLVVPRLDPRRRNYERFEETYWLLAAVIIGFLALLHAVTLGVALGLPVDVPRVVVVALGILFVVLGNYLPRVRPNWWMGIRTPWTLESDHVWQRTHRLAGRTFVAGGVLTIAGGFLPAPIGFGVVIASIAVASVVPFVYSYLEWRRELHGRTASRPE